jgi:O-antigen/teichoic acid export membrane protein
MADLPPAGGLAQHADVHPAHDPPPTDRARSARRDTHDATPGAREVEPAALPLTSGSLLARNTMWTLLGQSAPLLAAVAAIPVLIREMGAERFGVLTLAWVLIGYMSLLDLGLGRALTQRVAERLGAGREEDLHREVATSLGIMALLGVLAGVALIALSPWLTSELLRMPVAMRGEALPAFRWIALGVPFVVVTAGYAGILSAYQRFRALNAIRIPTSILSFVGPLVVLLFSNRLDHVVMVLVAGRIAGTIAHALVTARAVPWLGRRPRWAPAAVVPLIRMGGWMTVSNLISPLMVQLDRFLVGAWISLEAVTYYATPFEIATRLWIVSGPLAMVLFPAFGTALASDRARAALLYRRSLKYVWLVLCPVVIAAITLARDGMHAWLGAEFAARSTVVFQWLVLGILANSIAQMPYAMIQAAGQARRTAVLHMMELPGYLVLLWVLLHRNGIEGVAWAWCARMTVDALVMLFMAQHVLGAPALPAAGRWSMLIGLAGIAGAFAVQGLPLYLRAPYALAAVTAAGMLLGSRGMAQERAALMSMALRGRDAATRAIRPAGSAGERP